MSSRTTTKKSLCSIEPTCIRENEGFFRSFLLQHVTFFSVFPPSPLSLFRDPCFFFLRLPVEHILFCSFPFSSRLFLSPLSENFHLSVFCCCFFTSLLTVFFPPLTLLPVSVTLDFYISTLLLAAHSLYGLSSLFFSLVFQHPTKLPALLMTASNIWIQLLATWEMPNSDALSPNNLVCIKGHVNNVDVGQLVCGMDLGTN